MWVGLIQSVEGLNRAKRLTSPSERTLQPDHFQTETLLFFMPLALSWSPTVRYPGLLLADPPHRLGGDLSAATVMSADSL